MCVRTRAKSMAAWERGGSMTASNRFTLTY